MDTHTLAKLIAEGVDLLLWTELVSVLFVAAVFYLARHNRNKRNPVLHLSGSREENAAFEKAIDEIVAARLPTLAGK